MKPRSDMDEGPEASDKFREAMKAIVSVPKDSITKGSPTETAAKKKKAARRRR